MVCALSEVKTLSERSRTGIVDIQLGNDCLVSPEMIVFEIVWQLLVLELLHPPAWARELRSPNNFDYKEDPRDRLF